MSKKEFSKLRGGDLIKQEQDSRLYVVVSRHHKILTVQTTDLLTEERYLEQNWKFYGRPYLKTTINT